METQITNEQKYEDELLAVNWHLESACNYACDFCYAPLIEQRKLPHAFELTRTKNFQQTARAITNMTVRGAGAIGATAAYGLAQGVRAFSGKTPAAFERHVQRVYQTLASARPTAVDLVNALNDVRAAMDAGESVAQKQRLLAIGDQHPCAFTDMGHHTFSLSPLPF